MFRLSRLLLAAVLAAGVAAPAAAAEVDPLLPAESESVVFINVRQILDSELFKKYARGQVEQALQGNDAQKAMKELGLDPMKDVDRVTGGTWGKDKDDMKGVFVVRGKFDPEKLFAAAQEAAKKDADKLSIVSEGDYKMIKVTPENSDRPVYAAVASEKAMVVATDKKLVANTLAAAEKGGNKPQVKKELAALIRDQNEKASMFAVGLTDGKVGDIPPGVNIPGVDPDKLKKQLAGMRYAAMTLDLTADVALDITMGMKDADAAKDFGDTVEQLVNTAKAFIPLVAGQQPQFKPVADEVARTLKAKSSDSSVGISVKLSGAAIGKATGGDE